MAQSHAMCIYKIKNKTTQCRSMKKSLGKKLRQLRLNAGLSFEELELTTKISSYHLRNLEEEKYDKLPAPVFVRGFLQKWAHATKGNEQELYGMYNKSARPSLPKNVLGVVSLKVLRVPSFRYVFVVLCVVGAVVLFSYIYYNQFIAVRNPQVQITHPLDVDSVSLTQQVRLQGTTQSVENLTINGVRVALGNNGTFLYQYNLEQGLNTISFIATNQDGERVKIIRNILYGS